MVHIIVVKAGYPENNNFLKNISKSSEKKYETNLTDHKRLPLFLWNRIFANPGVIEIKNENLEALKRKSI
jgi:hypothetical protein